MFGGRKISLSKVEEGGKGRRVSALHLPLKTSFLFLFRLINASSFLKKQNRNGLLLQSATLPSAPQLL